MARNRRQARRTKPLDVAALIEKMELVVLDTDDLTPYAKNPRINDGAVDFVANSIRRFGFRVPIVVHGGDHEIISGHTRWKAAKQLGLKRVPCLLADELTDAEVRALRLADNKVAELAKWDDALLKVEIDALPDFDMPEFGFDIPENISASDGDERESFDGLENGNASTSEHILRCGEIYIPMTDDEYEAFKAACDEYAQENGVMHGFVCKYFCGSGE